MGEFVTGKFILTRGTSVVIGDHPLTDDIALPERVAPLRALACDVDCEIEITESAGESTLRVVRALSHYHLDREPGEPPPYGEHRAEMDMAGRVRHAGRFTRVYRGVR